MRSTRHAFDAALEAVERGAPGAPPSPPLAFAGRVAEVGALPAAPTSDGPSLWELALEWTPEADPAPAPPPAPPRSARPEDVADELRLFELRSAADIARARRRFMWDNHPDRCAEAERGLANRRVAVANMLLDRRFNALSRRRAG